MKEPVKFQRLTPVMISGKFFVEPKPDDGYIYRMEGDSLSTVGDDAPDIDPVRSAKQAKLPLFDYTPLMAMAKRPKSAPVAKDLRFDVRKAGGGRRVLREPRFVTAAETDLGENMVGRCGAGHTSDGL